VKIVTVLGTRPEIIRLSGIIAKLDTNAEHVLVDTGQNFDDRLNALFFRELGVRKPDYALGVRGGGIGEQIGQILDRCETVFREEQPDRLLILGDTNSSLCAIVAKRMGIPVLHMEAGNRCYDDRVPEEVNRRLIDHSSDVLMPYTERSRMNLLREGIAGERIFVTGNPIKEVIDAHAERIDGSTALAELGVEAGAYLLVTLHRAENVDVESRLRAFTDALAALAREYDCPVLVSTHPRTRLRIEQFGVETGGQDVRFLDPFGFFDFIALERQAACVLSDSGTVQEECAIFGVPNVTLRDVTERPETIECGSNILSGADPRQVLSAVRAVRALTPRWQPPPEYLADAVSDSVVRICLGYHHFLRGAPGRA
jgi:UDP-N-acetylglucosamine 2-epimerase (non-hydrolysing)